MNAPADANASRGNICVVWGWVAAFVWLGGWCWPPWSPPITFRHEQGAVKRGRDAANTAPVGRPKPLAKVPDLLSRRSNFVGFSYATCTVRWVDGVELSRKKGCILSILAAGSSQRPEWARCTPGGLMGVEPLVALPPRVLVAGRLQCGAARAGVRRGGAGSLITPTY